MKVSSPIIILMAFKFVPLIPVGQYKVEDKCYLKNSKLRGLLIPSAMHG